MMRVSVRKVGTACVLGTLLLASGCRRHRKSTSVENTTDYAGNLQALVATKKLPSLRWPNFSDYQTAVTTFYDDRNYELAWTRDGKPTATALAFIEQFKDAASKGLAPEDYDASLWAGRVQKLSGKPADAISEFDVAMTVNVMRYISDLRIGRVNPSHFNFDINVQSKKYNLAEFVSDHVVDATDVPKLIAGVEPDSEQYRQTEAALGHYLDLAKQQQADDAQPLPMVEKAVTVGEHYAAAPELLKRLQLEGDVAAVDDSDSRANSDDKPVPHVFTAELSEAVKQYQHRHGIEENGKLGPQTVKSLNVPLSERVVQLQDALERWRWLPDQYVNAPLMVNLPEFVLRGYTPDHKLDFKMKVVVGKVVGEHQTPVFAHMMRYLVFRPYWNVPVDIAKKELAPHVAADPGYLDKHNFEVTNGKHEVLTHYTAKQVGQGGVLVREKPGPKNSLGLVKFMFPNQYDIYLHSTPAPYLFDRSRRDFSHGCIRVQKPADLAVWVLNEQPDKDKQPWDMDKVQAAFSDETQNNRTVLLKTPIPIVIFYVTAEVEDDGEVHFFDDIYGYDADLQTVIEKGPPYPVKPEPVVPKTKPGDTV
ncbi:MULTISPECIES: murein L,D-transpeptidase [Acidobacteriaceae]|uniref:L,D-transpeptidase family protein n=1 Tax=Acidobacteriaceae TaxID=204434 RepID=UPI00131E50F6|nr:MULTISPECIES: L,D-transpeptidase family protein [Acidobacteriaceae]MDW5265780.1 L,D-transpeptidase family protein [Edaphobacter sp.]